MCEDVAAQKYGIVLAFNFFTPNDSDSFSLRPYTPSAGSESNDEMKIKAIRDTIRGMPINISAVHYCGRNEETSSAVAASIWMFVLGKVLRLKSRWHSTSSTTEIMYSLQNFGIRDFPMTHTGAIKTKHVKDFIKARKGFTWYSTGV